MRKLLLTATFLAFCFLSVAQTKPEFTLGAFQPGEKLKYKIRYGFVTAAEATLEVAEGKKELNNKKVFHFIASGKTTSSFDILMKVRNRYDSYVDQTELLPYQFTENIREGNYRRDSYANFDWESKRVIASKGTYKVPENTFDIISIFYFARCIDLKNVSVGQTLKMKYFLDDGVYPLNIEYVGKEKIKTATGTYECIKFSPSLQPGRVFRKDSKMYIWITNDTNRIPVKVEVEILIGSLVLELESYQGLKNTITSKR